MTLLKKKKVNSTNFTTIEQNSLTMRENGTTSKNMNLKLRGYPPLLDHLHPPSPWPVYDVMIVPTIGTLHICIASRAEQCCIDAFRKRSIKVLF